MISIRGSLLVNLVVVGLLAVGSGCKKDSTPTGGVTGGGKASELILGKWVCQKGDTTITLEFSADKVEGKWKSDGSGPSMNGTYKVLDESTVEMPKFAGGFEEKVKIESISKDKLVLSGFSHKAGSYEFTRPGGGGSGTGSSDTDRVMWIHQNGRFTKINATQWTEDVKWADMAAEHYDLVEAKRTPEYVELFNKSRECLIRLYADHCEVKFRDMQFETKADGLWVAPKPTDSGSIKDKLVGTWKMVKYTGELEFGRIGDTVTFTKEGKINKSSEKGNFSYKLDGNQLTTTETLPDGGSLSNTLTIKTATDDKLVILWTGQTEGPEFQRIANVPTRDTDKLIGTWEAPKTNDFPFDISIQFTKDGKMKMTVKTPKPVVKDATYTHDGDTISITRSEGGKEEKDAWTITALDDKKMVVVDGRGKKTEYKKK